MPELLLELFSEEIPARMQARAAEDLVTLLRESLELVTADAAFHAFHGPRRLTVRAIGLAEGVAEKRTEERGPRFNAPDTAIKGFVRKQIGHVFEGSDISLDDRVTAGLADLRETGRFDHDSRFRGSFTPVLEFRDTPQGQVLYAVRAIPARPTADLIARTLPGVLRSFPWPKSMRWGVSDFLWVRPLHRILCLLDGEVVRFDLRQGEDAAHGLAAGAETEGHRLMSPGAFAVRSFADYEAGLRARRVILDAAERTALIRDGIARLAAAEDLSVVPDEGLLAEVAGLVEWPVPLLGRIDDAFMDLPPEVMRTTMRVNQRYFALRTADGRAAPRFALVANIEASDGGAAIVAGNERVLRARLSDARFFWDQDRKDRLESRLPKLEDVVFHAKLGSQGDRIRRIERLAALVAERIGADPAAAARAARLAKADLASGMVGEFPELQGIMGRYYALHDGEAPRIAEAIAAHYRPLGPGDAVPDEGTAIAVALADKLDQLAGFFAIGEVPTGSGDPFAQRRAALGLIRIIRENGLRLGLRALIEDAFAGHLAQWRGSPWLAVEPEAFAARVGLPAIRHEVMEGAQRLVGEGLGRGERVLVRLLDLDWIEDLQAEGLPVYLTARTAEAAQLTRVFRTADAVALPRPAALTATLLDFLAERLRVQLRTQGARHDIVAAVFGAAPDDDLNRLLRRADAVRAFVDSETGANLLAAHRRAANILRIEEKRDGRAYDTGYERHLLKAPEEQALAAALEDATARLAIDLDAEDFERAMEVMAGLRGPVDAFFDRVTVNDPAPELRRNRLRLLARLRAALDAVADFSKLEG